MNMSRLTDFYAFHTPGDAIFSNVRLEGDAIIPAAQLARTCGSKEGVGQCLS